MSMTNSQVADIFDTVADYIEANEGESHRQKVAAVEAKINSIASAYKDATGEELPDTMRNKLASADDLLLDLFVKQRQTAGGSPDSLGGPTESPFQQKTASDADPDARFLSWING